MPDCTAGVNLITKVLKFVHLPKFVRTWSSLHTLRLSALPFFRGLLGYPLTN